MVESFSKYSRWVFYGFENVFPVVWGLENFCFSLI